MEIILHICSRQAWEAALKAGEYKAPSLESEGFTHCSLPDQIEWVANQFYAGQSGLVLLHIDAHRVLAELRWEDVGGETFPHIYGPLNLAAVVEVEEFPPDAQGRFTYPNT